MAYQDELRQLVKIATLYYDDGLNQASIARALNLSQSQVSRSLSRCQKEGLVKISVVQPPNIFVDLERQLQMQYGCSQVIVIDVPDGASQVQTNLAIGSSAAHYLETTLQNNDLIGISSWSETIRAMVENMHPLSGKAKGVVQILGGVGQNGNIQANMLTHSLARMLSTESYLLPASSAERSVESKQKSLKDPEVKKVVSLFDEVTLAIVGIGSIDPSVMLRNAGLHYEESETTKLMELGAVGDLCQHYIDKSGNPVLSEEEDPVVSMSIEQLRKCQRVVALAGGEAKIAAIKGALTGGYIDVLITDRLTANMLLAAGESS